MSSSSPGEITLLLSDFKNPQTRDKLMLRLYQELRRMAAGFFRRERPNHTLQPTALVNEAVMRLLAAGTIQFENRAHFFGVILRSMRQVLIEHGRRHGADKRGGSWQRVDLEHAHVASPEEPIDRLAVQEALDRLSQLDRKVGEIVRLKIFEGLSSREIADRLGIGESTVRRHWDFAKAWLQEEIEMPSR